MEEKGIRDCNAKTLEEMPEKSGEMQNRRRPY